MLLQQHPDWDWQRVKTTLMTTADETTERPLPHVEGAGLLDLPGATTETLQLNRGNVDFGFLRYPQGDQSATIELALTNTGSETQAVELADSALDHNDAPAAADLVTLSRNEVSVAPGATGRVTVTLTPGNGEPGLYSGLVVLTRSDLDPIGLPLSFTIEPPLHDLRLTVLNRRGEPWAGGAFRLVNAEDVVRGSQNVYLDENGRATARVRPGPYSVMAVIDTPAVDGKPASWSVSGSAEVMVDADMSFTIDARDAKRLEPATVEGERTEVSTASLLFGRSDASGVSTRELVATEFDYRSLTGEEATYWRARAPRSDTMPVGVVVDYDLRVPQERRVELATADPGLRWMECLREPELTATQLCSPETALEPDERSSSTWFRGPTPAVVETAHSFDSITLPIDLSDGEHTGQVLNAAAWGKATSRMFRNGVELSPTYPGSPYFSTPLRARDLPLRAHDAARPGPAPHRP